MTQREAVDALFAACPAASAEELVVDWDDSVFIWAGALARHLVEGLSEGRTEEVRAVLEVAEQLLTTGDVEIENLIQVGLFEGIQNVTGWRHLDGSEMRQEDFEPFLGPRSLACWLEVNFMWGGSTTPDP
jgi:hypothetical protein